ncbi:MULTISPECIES: YaaL family protein [Bacillus]|uniref:YaaL family protein n=1 Tax=Bacillus TaxID=1386 RepID=UPI000BB91A27|nr:MULTISPECIES: YaaL family protein [Bacillus]
MFFRKKDRLKNQFDEKIMKLTEENKDLWSKKKALVEKSLDPSEEVVCKLKLAEAKYLFLLKEVRYRKMKK